LKKNQHNTKTSLGDCFDGHADGVDGDDGVDDADANTDDDDEGGYDEGVCKHKM